MRPPASRKAVSVPAPVRLIRPEEHDVQLAPRIPGPAELERLHQLALRGKASSSRPASRREEEAATFWKERGAWYADAARADVPKSLWNLVLDPIRTPTLEAVAAFFNEGPDDDEDESEYGRCLGLLGDVGIGKTVAATWGIWYGGGDESDWFIAFPRMLRDLLNPSVREETAVRLREASLLVIDDFAAGAAYREGSYLEGMVEELLVERELARAWTVFTSNLRTEPLLDFVGDRVADRLLGPWGRLVEVAGENLRRRR